MRSAILFGFVVLSESIGAYTGWKLTNTNLIGTIVLIITLFIMDVTDWSSKVK